MTFGRTLARSLGTHMLKHMLSLGTSHAFENKHIGRKKNTLRCSKSQSVKTSKLYHVASFRRF